MAIIRRVTTVLALASLFSGWATTAAAQSASIPSRSTARPDPQIFEVEWKRRTEAWLRPGIEGWVYNPSGYRVGSVLLKVQTLDGASRVTDERSVWVYGHIPSRGRGYFMVPLPADDRATYRIVVDSFDLISLESP